jgi:uncharacterized protein (TIGR02391 family)
MSVTRHPLVDESVVRSLCDILGRTEDGLTNKEITELLAAARVPDPTPPPTKYTYVAINKRDRLFRALVAKQRKDDCGNAVLAFVGKALAPVRFHGSPEAFDALREEVNIPLAFAGYSVNDEGRVTRKAKARTLSQARQRAMRLRSQLVDRGAHPRLLSYCVEEIEDDNYFHAVLEGSKSLADEMRRRTGRSEDGMRLIDAVFEVGKRGHPLLALNSLSTETERSRHYGLAFSLRGAFASLRNPTAHEPKIRSTLTEQDAVDALGHMSYLHRRLDECRDVLHMATTI